MKLSDINQKSLNTTKESIESLSKKVSSTEYVSEALKENSRIIHPIDYSDPKNFAKFGSAEKYYTDTISNIYNTFPYDGSKKERQEWRNNSSDLDLYILDNLYPKIDKDSLTYLIAQLQVETGIPASEWLAMDERIFRATLAYMKEKAKRTENASRSKRTR